MSDITRQGDFNKKSSNTKNEIIYIGDGSLNSDDSSKASENSDGFSEALDIARSQIEETSSLIESQKQALKELSVALNQVTSSAKNLAITLSQNQKRTNEDYFFSQKHRKNLENEDISFNRKRNLREDIYFNNRRKLEESYNKSLRDLHTKSGSLTIALEKFRRILANPLETLLVSPVKLVGSIIKGGGDLISSWSKQGKNSSKVSFSNKISDKISLGFDDATPRRVSPQKQKVVGGLDFIDTLIQTSPTKSKFEREFRSDDKFSLKNPLSDLDSDGLNDYIGSQGVYMGYISEFFFSPEATPVGKFFVNLFTLKNFSDNKSESGKSSKSDPKTLVTLAIIGLIATALFLLAPAINTLITSLAPVIASGIEWLVDLLKQLTPYIMGFVKFLSDFLSALWEKIKGTVINSIASVLNLVFSILEKISNFILDLLNSPAMQVLGEVIIGVLEIIAIALKIVVDVVKWILKAIQKIPETFMKFKDWIFGLPSKLWEGAKNFFAGAKNFLGNLFGWNKTEEQKQQEQAEKEAKEAEEKLRKEQKKEQAAKERQIMLTNLGNFFNGLWEGLKSWLSEMLLLLELKFRVLGNWVKSLFNPLAKKTEFEIASEMYEEKSAKSLEKSRVDRLLQDMKKLNNPNSTTVVNNYNNSTVVGLEMSPFGMGFSFGGL